MMQLENPESLGVSNKSIDMIVSAKETESRRVTKPLSDPLPPNPPRQTSDATTGFMGEADVGTLPSMGKASSMNWHEM